MEFDKYRLILASASPRRKELLSWLQIPFDIIPSDIEEYSEVSDPALLSEDLALQKGKAVWDKSPADNPIVVASDTVVALGQTVYGKPKDKEDARRILLKLSGKTHTVFTGVSLIANRAGQLRQHCFHSSTQVTFDSISEDILDPYLETGESLDKAGAYGIQGPGLCFISHVEGSYSNVVGFPLSEFITELKSFIGQKEDWRSCFV
jgi:septum formation protein